MNARTTASRAWLAVFTAILLAGCAATPDLGARPQISAPARFATDRSFAVVQAAWPADQWWEAYGDPQLNALIEEALADSPNLAAAAARVRQAQAYEQQTEASRLPSLSAETGAQALRQHLSADNVPNVISDALPGGWSTRGKAALQLNYQLDFFGRYSAAIAAATSRAQAAEAEAAAARLQISTAVASAYADLSRLYADRAAAEEAVRLRQDSSTLIHQRLQKELENEGQAKQSESELARARADLIAVNGSIERARNEIAALLGKGPDRGLEITAPAHLQIAALALPATVGLDLMGRRPDVTAARLRAEAAAKRIDVARADYYPNVNLSAMIGLQTLGLDSLGGGTLSFGQIGPAVSLPIFTGGRLEGAYRGARAEYDEAVALYDQALTKAFKDVADAVADRRTLEARLVESRTALDAAVASYRLARLRYDGGLASYIDVLTVENALIVQRHTVADLEARAFALHVAMVRALGGGFGAVS